MTLTPERGQGHTIGNSVMFDNTQGNLRTVVSLKDSPTARQTLRVIDCCLGHPPGTRVAIGTAARTTLPMSRPSED